VIPPGIPHARYKRVTFMGDDGLEKQGYWMADKDKVMSAVRTVDSLHTIMMPKALLTFLPDEPEEEERNMNQQIKKCWFMASGKWRTAIWHAWIALGSEAVYAIVEDDEDGGIMKVFIEGVRFREPGK
jgi:hypothetical protein